MRLGERPLRRVGQIVPPPAYQANRRYRSRPPKLQKSRCLNKRDRPATQQAVAQMSHRPLIWIVALASAFVELETVCHR